MSGSVRPLRAQDFKLDEYPETPDPDMVPPPSHNAVRGEAILHGDEIEVPPRSYSGLDPYSTTRPGRLTSLSGALNRAGSRIRTIRRSVTEGSLTEDVRAYAQEWKDRAADIFDDVRHSSERAAQTAQERASQWTHIAQDRAIEWKERAEMRGRVLRVRTERFIDERPAQAVAVSAGIGFAVGVLLRMGRPRREY
jgi:ElaB/YqjD/DUF883 family membrane-anchored ribosome-binding protein